MKIDESLRKFATPRQASYLDAVNKYGSQRKAAKALGVHNTTIGEALGALQRKAEGSGVDTVIREAAIAGGVDDPDNLSHFWKIVKDENGNGHSLFIKNPATKEEVRLTDMIREAAAEGARGRPKYTPRPFDAHQHLLMIDLADVHFLKLATETETGAVYNREVARQRVIEGTRSLLKMAKPMGVQHILFVIGNDMLHMDNAQSTTTSGTFQDSEGTIYQGFMDAKDAFCDAILECAEVAPVDLLHNMSNHDWTMGWALSQTLGAIMSKNKRVRATPYNLSERHRKYFRFEKNLIGSTHGDGAKEEHLYSLMVKEAREHISECPHLYWKLHHFHHKRRRTRGELPYLRERDHGNMTLMVSGEPREMTGHVDIEYVRSPSAPDGWHDRNGYINRQGVECFLFHPSEGQRGRFTEWF